MSYDLRLEEKQKAKQGERSIQPQFPVLRQKYQPMSTDNVLDKIMLKLLKTDS